MATRDKVGRRGLAVSARKRQGCAAITTNQHISATLVGASALHHPHAETYEGATTVCNMFCKCCRGKDIVEYYT